LNRLDEQLNGARYRLGQVRAQERLTRPQLLLARQQYALAQRRVERRLVTIYESSAPSTADAVLGATSVSSILDRLQLTEAAGRLDDEVVQAARVWHGQLGRREAALATEDRQQAAAAATIATHRRTLTVEIGERRVLLGSIQNDVRRLEVEAAARLARLAAAARARLAAQLKAQAATELRARVAAATAARVRTARGHQARPGTAAQASHPAAITTSTIPTTPTATTPAAPPPTTTTDASQTNPLTTPTTSPPPAPGHPEAGAIALHYLGVPYVFGGASPSGFDCSGLVMYVYAQLGIHLPHYAAAQYGYGVPIARPDLQPGDLVFFDGLGHVGIYIGNNELVDAPHTGAVVQIETLTGWYADTYVGARRI
jgi:cell wall-associated NlpC family hydrolase